MALADAIALVASWAKPVREPVEGAPFQPGQVVVVVGVNDASVDNPEAWTGQVCVVDYLEYSCGCGQSYPDWPMIGVRSGDGRGEEFWPDELRLSVEIEADRSVPAQVAMTAALPGCTLDGPCAFDTSLAGGSPPASPPAQAEGAR